MDLKNETKMKKKIAYIDFKIENEKELEDRLSILREWYNRHWFMSKEVLEQQAKKFICDAIKIRLVEND